MKIVSIKRQWSRWRKGSAVFKDSEKIVKSTVKLAKDLTSRMSLLPIVREVLVKLLGLKG